MRKTILLGLSLTVFLLVSIPSVSAVQFKLVEDHYKGLLERNLFSRISKRTPISSSRDTPQPLFFPILGIIVYGLILLLIAKIVLWILGEIGGVIATILDIIRGKINNIIETIWFLIKTLFNVFTSLVSMILKILHVSGKIIITVILLLVTLIWLIVGTIITLIFTIIIKLWNLLGLIIGVILDILRIIYDAIFH